jgi:hypothetical protein
MQQSYPKVDLRCIQDSDNTAHARRGTLANAQIFVDTLCKFRIVRSLEKFRQH